MAGCPQEGLRPLLAGSRALASLLRMREAVAGPMEAGRVLRCSHADGQKVLLHLPRSAVRHLDSRNVLWAQLSLARGCFC